MPVVELKIDRNLLCPKFDGYKLSLDAVPVLRQDFQRNPLKLEPHANQYSLLHVELFAKHNLLVSDPWARNNCYYINEGHQVMRCSYDEQHGQPQAQHIVHTILRQDHGDGYQHKPGDYNYTLRFISEKLCVLCDGMVTYHLLDTGDRQRAETWQLLTRSPIADDELQRGFVLLDARLDIVQERKQISLVAGHVERRQATCGTRHATDVHVMQLHWSRWTLKVTPNAAWTYEKCVQLETKGSIYYCAFEPRAESLIMCANADIQTQAELQAAQAAAETQAVAEAQSAAPAQGELTQDMDTAPAESTEQQDSVSDSESEPERLPIPNLEDPIEECDFPLSSANTDIKMVRFHLPLTAITHTIHLGTNPPLFASSLRAGYPAAFVTRQGVDAAVWLQSYQPAKPHDWSVRHEGTLHAFGYVLASKQQRKYVDCCPELDYAVISESYRHMFIYKPRYDSAAGLRNRNGPQVIIGKQNLITLDDDLGEVIGMVTAPNVITVLTEHAVLYIQV